MITCTLRPQWECYLTRTVGANVTGQLWEWREPRSASMMNSSPRRRCPYSFPRPPAVRPPKPQTYTRAGRWVIPVWWQFIYDWRLLNLSVTVLDDWSCLMQPRCVVHTHIHTSWRHQAASVVRALPGVERRDAWQINCWYRISHVHFTRTPTPVSFHQCLPRSAVRRSA